MKTLTRRALWGTVVLLAAAAQAMAQAPVFGQRGLRIVVPFGAGGVGDLTARTVAAELAVSLGRPVTIDNRPGAGGVVAAESVARAAPDGHTLFLMSNGSAVTASLFKNLPFDMQKDFRPVSTLGYFDMAVVVPSASPFKTMADLLAHAKAHPGQVNVGSIHVGSTQHLAAELFKSSAKVDVQIVPYKGTPALVGALRGEQVDVGVEMLAPVLSQIQSGAMRALAVTGTKRSVALPEIPTAQEAGVPGYVASSWNALAVPAATPEAVVQRLNQEINDALSKPAVRQQLMALNIDAQGSTSAQAAELLANDIRRWALVIEQAQIPRQ